MPMTCLLPWLVLAWANIVFAVPVTTITQPPPEASAAVRRSMYAEL